MRRAEQLNYYVEEVDDAKEVLCRSENVVDWSVLSRPLVPLSDEKVAGAAVLTAAADANRAEGEFNKSEDDD